MKSLDNIYNSTCMNLPQKLLLLTARVNYKHLVEYGWPALTQIGRLDP